MPSDYVTKLLSVLQSNSVEPLAPDRRGGVVQKHDGRQIRSQLQPAGQPTQLRTTQQSGQSAWFLRIESDQLPVLETLLKYNPIVEESAGLRKDLMQRHTLIVVSGNNPQPLTPIR
jgi:hypothetical protein